MAWIFSLSAECGTDKNVAQAFASHFDKFSVVLSDGTRHVCSASPCQPNGEAWWACVCPDGISRSGIGNENDQRQMTEIGFALYERLRSAPSYRYALVGVEVDGFRAFEDLDEDVADPATSLFDGLVITDIIWQRLCRPGIFVPFAAGYRWRPFVHAN